MSYVATRQDQLVELVLTHVRGRVTAAREAGHGVRLGVDGCVPDDAARLADDVAAALAAEGVAAPRVRQRDFVLPRSQRLEHGSRDPDAQWERWFDDAALRREVLDAVGPTDPHLPSRHPMRWLPSLRDPGTDRSTRAALRDLPPGGVVVVDGAFLLRWELADAFDVTVHLQTGPDAQRRRLADEDERARLVPSWQRYLDETDPAARATVVVRHEHPDRPAVRQPAPADL